MNHCPCGDYRILKFFIEGGSASDEVRAEASAALEDLHSLRAELKEYDLK